MLNSKRAASYKTAWTGTLSLLSLVLAFALRLYRLEVQSFAFDEGWTSYAIHHSWAEMWGVLAPDNHPPLYYVLVKAFAEVAGYGDFSVRFFSVICGVAMVAGLYTLGRRLGGVVMGLSAALFAAVAPSFVYYGQEARMYSLLMALAVFSSYGLWRTLEEAASRRWWMLYVGASCAALYTHYFAVLLLVAQNIVWALWILLDLVRVRARSRELFWSGQMASWGLSQAMITALYLPWLPTAIRQARIGQGTFWRMPLPALMIVKDIWRFFVLGPRRPPDVPSFGAWLGPVAVAGMAALLLGWRLRARAWAFVLLVLTLPVGLLVLIGSLLPLYTDRYTLIAAPGLALAVGMGIASCWHIVSGQSSPAVESHSTRSRAWAHIVALILLLVVLAAPAPHLRAYYTDETYWREDFRRAASYVMAKSRAGDTVVLVGSYQPIMQYYDGAADVVRFPQRGDIVLDEREVVQRLRESVRPGSSVRLVMYSWETVDPQSLIEGQLRAECEFRGEHWQQETGQRPIRVLNFVACDGDFVLEPRQPIDAVWDGQIVLSAYHLVDMAPGKRARVILWWRTLRRPDRDYSVFVHLLDRSGTKIVQYDKLPLSNFYPMRAWPVNVDHRDSYLLKIPPDADLEGASLAVGLYDARKGQRLPVLQADLPVGDFARIPLNGHVGADK